MMSDGASMKNTTNLTMATFHLNKLNIDESNKFSDNLHHDNKNPSPEQNGSTPLNSNALDSDYKGDIEQNQV